MPDGHWPFQYIFIKCKMCPLVGASSDGKKIATFCDDKHHNVNSTASAMLVVLTTFRRETHYGIHGKFTACKMFSTYANETKDY